MQTIQEAGKTLFAAVERGELAAPGRRVNFQGNRMKVMSSRAIERGRNRKLRR